MLRRLLYRRWIYAYFMTWIHVVVHSLDSLALLYSTGTCHILTAFSLDRLFVISALAPCCNFSVTHSTLSFSQLLPPVWRSTTFGLKDSWVVPIPLPFNLWWPHHIGTTSCYQGLSLKLVAHVLPSLNPMT